MTRPATSASSPFERSASFKRPLDGEIRSSLMSIALHIVRRRSEVMATFDRVYEEWSERAAIREYLNDGLSRWRAELEAVRDAGEMLGVRFK